MKIDIKKRNKSWNITIKCKDKSIKFDYIQFINMLFVKYYIFLFRFYRITP